MAHVVPPDGARGVGQPVGMRVGCALEQQGRRVDGAARDHHDVAAEALLDPVPLDHHVGDGVAGRIGLEPLDLRVCEQRDIVVLECRPHGADVRVCLRVEDAGEAVEAVAADAARALGI